MVSMKHFPQIYHSYKLGFVMLVILCPQLCTLSVASVFDCPGWYTSSWRCTSKSILIWWWWWDPEPTGPPFICPLVWELPNIWKGSRFRVLGPRYRNLTVTLPEMIGRIRAGESCQNEFGCDGQNCTAQIWAEEHVQGLFHLFLRREGEVAHNAEFRNWYSLN